jgi:glycosyltransferase involved in cell wall biosynthesis
MIKVVHLTSVHPRYDTRILKECSSLAKNNYKVTLVVADNKGNETCEGVSIVDVGKVDSRLSRYITTTRKVYKMGLKLDADIYHFHDPELIFYGYFLKRKGKRVIYDVHEDVPLQIFSKPYLSKWQKRIISKIFNLLEKRLSRKFDYVLTATSFLKSIFLKYNSNSIDIYNFPIQGQLSNNAGWKDKENAILYVGSISKDRGIFEVIESLNLINPPPVFYIGGKFSPINNEDTSEVFDNMTNIKFLGFIDKKKYKNLCEISKIGIITDHPLISYVDAYATKMFEYMEAGLPVICSNFPNWVKIINEYHCGIAVDPYDTRGIASAIKLLLEDDQTAMQMGENGKKAVNERFNWKIEEIKLLEVYNQLVN